MEAYTTSFLLCALQIIRALLELFCKSANRLLCPFDVVSFHKWSCSTKKLSTAGTLGSGPDERVLNFKHLDVEFDTVERQKI